MDPKWFPALGRPSYHPEPVLLAAFLFQVTSLLIPSRLTRIALAVPFFLICVVHIRTHSAGLTADDYLTGVNIYWLILRWIDLAVLTDAEASLWQMRPEPATEHKKPPSHRGILSKVGWSLSLCTTYRGIGWNWRVKNVDKVPAHVSRLHFVTIQLLKFIRVYLISDIVSYYLRSVAFQGLSRPDYSLLSTHNKVAVGWAIAIRAVADLSILYYLTAAIAVTIRFSQPEDWPPMFGSWLEMYTVRKVWGYSWHQLLRRLFEVYTENAANSLGLRKGILFTRYFKLYGAFLLSGILHHCGSLNVPWTLGAKYHFLYFIAQPFIITFEDFAIYIGKQLGFKSGVATRLLGYVWVMFSFSLTLPMMAKSLFAWTLLERGLSKRHPIIMYSFAERVFG